jgi:hypothetical protein
MFSWFSFLYPVEHILALHDGHDCTANGTHPKRYCPHRLGVPESVLRDFAACWRFLRIEGDRIPGCYGFLTEHDGELWMWTHSHSPNGHEFFPVIEPHDFLKAVVLLLGYWR